MLSGFGGKQKSKIVMSLIAGQDTTVFANGMNLREGITGEREGDCWQVSCTSFLVTCKDFTGSKAEEMSREHSGVQTKMKNGMEFTNSKVVKGPTVQGRWGCSTMSFYLKKIGAIEGLLV